MSTSTVAVGSARAARFWNTTNGKKAVMAVTGAVLFGFIVVHLADNLQIFLGPERFNGFARLLHEMAGLLWVLRVALIVAVGLHIWSTIQLAIRKSDARPVSYARYQASSSSYASRTMYMSGPIVAAFVVYHLLHLTFGLGGTPFNPDDVFGNVIAGFRVPVISIVYIIAIALLCLHLRHGIWSAFQTLGLHHPRYTPRLRILATLIALMIFFGFISIPIAVMTHVIPQIF
jgi:succinate dehydrogenase / fumarate reductase, cytochrome b subunit